jgi:hypothetical protein
LQIVQNTTTSNEFLLWCQYLEERKTRRDPVHWYLARIAMEIVQNRNPKKKLRLENFLLKFESNSSSEPKTEAEKVLREQQSRAFWLGSVMGDFNPDPTDETD